MGTTTIQITEEQREKLERLRNDGEPVRNALDRLLGNENGELWTEKEIRDVADRQIERSLREYGGGR